MSSVAIEGKIRMIIIHKSNTRFSMNDNHPYFNPFTAWRTQKTQIVLKI